MKRIVCILLIFITITLYTAGCSSKVIYELREPQENIKSIEIGIRDEFTGSFESEKLLSESEIIEFLEGLKKIDFRRIYFGDPPTVCGLTIKITYHDGGCELLSWYWSQYIKDGRYKEGWQRCEKEDFENLISKFYDIESDVES